MKKLITFLVAILITGALFSQTSNIFQYVITANGGLTVPVNTFKIGTVTVTATGTQLNYVDATSSIQTQITATADILADTTDVTNIIPMIYSGAGDTSLYATPGKIGNIYINTSTGDVYISIKAIRHDGWVKVN